MGHIHSEEFRREAVRIAQTSGLTRKQIASDLGIGFSTLSNWVQSMKQDGLSSAPQEDLAKENERLRSEETFASSRRRGIC